MRKGVALTLDDCHQTAAEHGGLCLSTTYVNTHKTKMKWQCAKGHVFETYYKIIRKGSWCTICATGLYSLEEVRAFCAEKGGKCLSAQYKNVKTKMLFECRKAHRWEAVFHSLVTRGTWCGKCSMNMPEIEELHQHASSKGGKCHSLEFINGHASYDWTCAEGHSWSAMWYSVKAGRWCGICSQPRGNIETLQMEAEKHGGKCLSTKYVDINTRYLWECKEGHQFEMRAIKVRCRGRWCRHCAYGMYSIEEIREICNTRGGEFLGGDHIRTHLKYDFRCALGHEWRTSLGVVISGSWCPRCRSSRGEQELICVFEELNLRYIRQYSYEDCRDLRRLKFDFYLPDHDILVEFDGIQHFKVVEYFGGFDGFAERVRKDYIKSDYCLENGKPLIRIAFDQDVRSTFQMLYEQCHVQKICMFTKIKTKYSDQVEALYDDISRYESYLVE